MTEWTAKRFWKAADVRRERGGWAIVLDERPVRTPARQPLVAPTQAMAQAIADEWAAQGERIDPLSMPVTRAANAAIDKVSRQREEVVAILAAYGETDLLCYRAEAPDTLTLRQADGWDPLLAWAEERFRARLVPVAGVMPQPQDPHSIRRLTAEVDAMDVFDLTALHDLVMLSGSLVLALAVYHRRLSAPHAWELSRIDEEYQADLWGRDEDAEVAAAIRRDAFLAAERLVALNRGQAGRP